MGEHLCLPDQKFKLLWIYPTRIESTQPELWVMGQITSPECSLMCTPDCIWGFFKFHAYFKLPLFFHFRSSIFTIFSHKVRIYVIDVHHNLFSLIMHIFQIICLWSYTSPTKSQSSNENKNSKNLRFKIKNSLCSMQYDNLGNNALAL